MKIGLVGPLHPWRGGIAQYLGLLGEALQARAEVRAVSFTRQYPGFLFPGESQIDQNAPRPPFPVASLLDSIGPWTWPRSAAHLQRFGPGLVILKWWIPFFAPAFGFTVGPLRARGTRVVLVCDNLVPHEHRPGDRELTQFMLRRSDGYLVMSDSVERDLDALKPGAPRRRVAHPIYAQFDRGRWTRESARAHLKLDGEVAVFFGYVRPYKGLDVLLRAWPRVRERRAATLVVGGEFYEDAKPYRDLAAAAGDSVRMFDRYLPDEEVEALFKAADVVVLPYRSATQSGVTHVAYALGVPVITTDVGGLSETVKPGVTGMVVAPENPEALAAAIIEYFEGGLAPKLRAGVAELQASHSWSVLADAAISLGDELAPGRGWK
jgi:glycosyltransferase involved in cell wall biosynthesis